MSFEEIYKSALNNELILIDGGYCRFRLRKDKVLVIYEIISIRRGAGKMIFEKLLDICKKKKYLIIKAICPIDLESNLWYKKKKFKCVDIINVGRKGRKANVWKYSLDKSIKLIDINFNFKEKKNRKGINK